MNSERLKQLKKFSKELAKGKEKVEVNQHLQQLKIFSEEFTEKSSKIGKVCSFFPLVKKHCIVNVNP